MGRTLLLALAATLTACGGDDADVVGAASWEVVVDGHRDGLLLSIWGRGPDDVWAVGGRSGRPLVLRGGDRLSPLDAPGDQTAWWVCGLGDSATAVVGADGMALVDTGEGLAARVLGVEGILYGCWGESPDDWWVVGGDRASGTPALANVTPDGVVAPNLGDLVPQLPPVLYKVWGVDGWLFVVGEEGAVLTRNPDGAWTLERLPGVGAPLFTVHGRSATDVWAVGGAGAGEAWRFDGQAWSSAAPPAGAGLSGVFADDAGVTWLSGMFGRLLRHEEGAGFSEEDPGTPETLHAVWADGAGGVWAVGGNVEATSDSEWRGVVVRR